MNNSRSEPHSSSKSNWVIIMRRGKREKKKKEKIDFEDISKLRVQQYQYIKKILQIQN